MIKDFLKLISLMLCISALCNLRGNNFSAHTPASSTRFVLRVIPPINCPALPGLRCYYKGDRYKLNELFCVIPGESEVGLVTIIITRCIEPVYRANRPNHWRLIDGEATLWFECKQVCKKGGEGHHNTYEWVISEQQRDAIPSRIPESAIIVLTAPELIAGIVSPPPSEILPTRSLCNLPFIQFKKEISREEFKNAMVETLCAIPTIETFHCPAE